MANESFSPVIGFEDENPISLLTPDRDGSFENLDPDLEQYSTMQKITVEYSIYVPANGGFQSTSAQFGHKSNGIQPCIHFCNKGSCYETDLPISSIGWNQFQFLLFESTNNSEARLHELIRKLKDVFITGYVSNDPELRKNRRFILKDRDSFEKWKLSSSKHPKAEIGVKILTPTPKERLEIQKKIDLVSSMEPVPGEMAVGLASTPSLGNTTDARVKAVMSQLIKEYPINDKYSKESQVFVNTANPKEYIHITYEMRKTWARMILDGVATVTMSRPPLFDSDFQPWLVLGAKKKKRGSNTYSEEVLQQRQPPQSFAYSALPRSPSPELPPQVGEYSFDKFLEFAGLDKISSSELNHLHKRGLDKVKVLLSKHTTYDRLISMSFEHGLVAQLLDGAISWKKKILREISEK